MAAAFPLLVRGVRTGAVSVLLGWALQSATSLTLAAPGAPEVSSGSNERRAREVARSSSNQQAGAASSRGAGARRGAASPTVTAKSSYVEALVATTRALRLADYEMWRRLLRYRAGSFGGYASEADGRTFFLAPDGRTNPAAELEATVRGFFRPASRPKELEHPLCRFPARLLWLNEKLHFDFTQFSQKRCPKFEEYLGKVRPESLVLVFSSYYLNNPASAFGHTFLRINKAGRHNDEEGIELLDYGIDFSAVVDTSNAFLYAVKGLTGMFPGTFRKIPYYLKVREYNDFESRDIWEYELNLTPVELRRVVAHLWELGFNYFDYFYLSENCSYHILGALEVANPKFKLLSRTGWPVIPADTVKAIVAEPGLVKSVRYRPSNRASAMARVERLSTRERTWLARIIDDPKTPFPAELPLSARVRVVDAALDLLDFKYARELVQDPEDPEPADGSVAQQVLLERRALLPADSDETEVEPPLAKMPHYGHDSSRIGLGSGYSEGEGLFHTLDFRLALHDLADPAAGYPDEAAIEFLPVRLRYYAREPRLSLEDMSLIRVVSLTPLERFLKGWSWTVRAGATRIQDSACDGCVAALGEFGAGVAVAPFGPKLLSWLLLDAEVLAPVAGGLFDALRAGVGPVAGVRWRLAPALALLGTGKLHWLPTQAPRVTWQAKATLRWQYLRGFAVSLDAAAAPVGVSAEAVSHIYF